MNGDPARAAGGGGGDVAAVLGAALLDAVASPIFVKDARLRFVFVNDALCRLVGIERGRMIGRDDGAFFPPEQVHVFAERDRRVLDTGASDVNRERLRGVDGEDRIVVTRKSRLVAPDGVRYLVGVIEDVTEREHAEERVRRAHAATGALLDAVPVPLYVRDRGGLFAFVNRAYCDFVGAPREALLGAPCERVYRDAARCAQVRARDAEVFASGGPREHEVSITDADGHERRVLTHRALVHDERGEAVMVGVFTDITELRDARESMRVAAEVYEHTTEGIVVIDASRKVVSANKAFEAITGFREADVIGIDGAALLEHQQMTGSLVATVQEALRTSGQWQGEFVGRRRSGELYPAWATLSRVRDDAHGAGRIIAIFSDVTERKASEERVRWLAFHDVLTGLANRRLLDDRADSALLRARRYGHRVALIAVDLDRFKTVNDRLGHPVGDRLLEQAAGRMREVVRATDTVARIGGDEFAVLLADPKEGADAERVAMAIVEALARPFGVDGHAIQIGASAGVSVFPDDGADLATLLGVADRSLYRVKQQGRGGVARHGAEVRREGAGGHASGDR